MSRIDEAKKILGDDFVIVPLENWNNDVEEFNRLKEENRRLAEEKDSFQRVGIRTLEKLKMAEKNLEKLSTSNFSTFLDMTPRESYEGFASYALKELRED